MFCLSPTFSGSGIQPPKVLAQSGNTPPKVLPCSRGHMRGSRSVGPNAGFALSGPKSPLSFPPRRRVEKTIVFPTSYITCYFWAAAQHLLSKETLEMVNTALNKQSAISKRGRSGSWSRHRQEPHMQRGLTPHDAIPTCACVVREVMNEFDRYAHLGLTLWESL